jgi:hypothetical protein
MERVGCGEMVMHLAGCHRSRPDAERYDLLAQCFCLLAKGFQFESVSLVCDCVELGIAAVAYLMMTGVGVWGLNRTIGWAFDITNFVFWVGIGHAGTLISVCFCFARSGERQSTVPRKP